MKPHAKITLSGFPKLTPAEMAVLAAVFGNDGWLALDLRAASRATYHAKRYLAAWLGRAFFDLEHKSFTDARILACAARLCQQGFLLGAHWRLPQTAMLTTAGRLAALKIKETYGKPLSPEQFQADREGARVMRTGRFAP